jgi:hypothetical protein
LDRKKISAQKLILVPVAKVKQGYTRTFGAG